MKNKLLSNEMYDLLKSILMYVIPAIAFIVSTVMTVWHLPYGSEICQTFAAVEGGLAIFLGLKSAQYYETEDLDFEEDEEDCSEEE